MTNLSNDQEGLPRSNVQVGLPPICVSVTKKKRNLPGHPDPDAEVIALSPRSLLTTNRFVCEICNKGFQRDQNLQLHRRGHNLPWRLKHKENHEVRKKVYICPELNCVHHDPARALGDLTGIKKHFFRKHGEKKWKCDKCSKRYAVQSDWKAHQKTCGTKEYRCECGTLFSRKDSFITHRAFCDVVENGKDPACNVESQKPENSQEDNTDTKLNGQDSTKAMEGASSPNFHVNGDVLAPTDMSTPLSNERVSDSALPVVGIASLSSGWMRGGAEASNNRGLGQGPGLSLCLGTGPGPGPPDALQEGTRRESASAPPFKLSGSRWLDKSVTFPQTANLKSKVTSTHVPSKGAMGMLANLFSSAAHRQSVDDASERSGCSLSMNDRDFPTFSSFSAGASSMASSNSILDDSFGAPKAYLHSAHAATSATALLQKAAQMGAKLGGPCAFYKHGIGGGDLSFSMATQGIPREAVRDSSGDVGSNLMPAPNEGNDSKIDRNTGASPIGARHVKGNTLVSGGARMSGALFPDRPSRGEACGDFVTRGIRTDEDKPGLLQNRSGFGDCAGKLGEGENKMVDFLGVGGAGRVMMSRNSAGMGPILSHRDMASMTSLTTGMKRFPHTGSKAG